MVDGMCDNRFLLGAGEWGLVIIYFVGGGLKVRGSG